MLRQAVPELLENKQPCGIARILFYPLLISSDKINCCICKQLREADSTCAEGVAWWERPRKEQTPLCPCSDCTIAERLWPGYILFLLCVSLFPHPTSHKFLQRLCTDLHKMETDTGSWRVSQSKFNRDYIIHYICVGWLVFFYF